MEFEKLLGKTEEEARRYFQDKGWAYRFVYTSDPYKNRHEQDEKRIIRLRGKNKAIEILIGYFQNPDA